MKIYLIITIFLLMNAFFIISENNLNLNTTENIKNFFSLYSGWFKNIGNNIGTITGDVVKLNWIPENTEE